MIIEVDGKRIAFGMQWRSRLSEGDVHGDARAAKSRYFWYADKAFYFGVLPESDAKVKLKAPLYAGAVALVHRYPDVQNLVMVLEIPKGKPDLPNGGYIVCGIHTSRPRNNFDEIVTTEDEVTELLKKFQHLCGAHSFKLYGDVHLGGIEPGSMEDVVKGIDQAAVLRKTKSAMVNPLAFASVGVIVIGAGIYGYNAYGNYKRAEAQKLAAAAQKNSQQIYTEELAARRLDGTVLARDVNVILTPLRAMTLSKGGWTLSKATCTLPPQKQMACAFDYARKAESKATYATFLAAAGAKEFDNVEFVGEAIKATKVLTGLAFSEHGKAIDAGKLQRDETVEFGSALQLIDRFGKTKREPFQPFAVPPTANVGELTSPPVMAAGWEFIGPFRNLTRFASFPPYATISQLAVTYTDKPAYEQAQSLAMVTVSGKIFSKPN